MSANRAKYSSPAGLATPSAVRNARMNAALPASLWNRANGSAANWGNMLRGLYGEERGGNMAKSYPIPENIARKHLTQMSDKADYDRSWHMKHAGNHLAGIGRMLLERGKDAVRGVSNIAREAKSLRNDPNAFFMDKAMNGAASPYKMFNAVRWPVIGAAKDFFFGGRDPKTGSQAGFFPMATDYMDNIVKPVMHATGNGEFAMGDRGRLWENLYQSTAIPFYLGINREEEIGRFPASVQHGYRQYLESERKAKGDDTPVMSPLEWVGSVKVDDGYDNLRNDMVVEAMRINPQNFNLVRNKALSDALKDASYGHIPYSQRFPKWANARGGDSGKSGFGAWVMDMLPFLGPQVVGPIVTSGIKSALGNAGEAAVDSVKQEATSEIYHNALDDAEKLASKLMPKKGVKLLEGSLPAAQEGFAKAGYVDSLSPELRDAAYRLKWFANEAARNGEPIWQVPVKYFSKAPDPVRASAAITQSLWDSMPFRRQFAAAVSHAPSPLKAAITYPMESRTMGLADRILFGPWGVTAHYAGRTATSPLWGSRWLAGKLASYLKGKFPELAGQFPKTASFLSNAGSKLGTASRYAEIPVGIIGGMSGAGGVSDIVGEVADTLGRNTRVDQSEHDAEDWILNGRPPETDDLDRKYRTERIFNGAMDELYGRRAEQQP